MAEITIKTDYPEEVHKVLSETIETEISKIQYSLSLIKKRLLKFEKKYNTSSENFIENWTAEDLEGKDMEYVIWAGEFKHYTNLQTRLNTIKNISHVSAIIY
jgi:DNA repair photolyase